MSVFNRLSDIINSNVNAILEQAEDPEKMVRMITQEMEETLVEVRSASARHLADRKRLTTSIARVGAEARQWEAKAERAIERGRDDLARAALKERTKLDEAVTMMEADLAAIDAAVEKLQQDTVQLEEKLHTARVRQKALIMRGKTAKSRAKVKRQIHSVSFDEAFDKFEQYERRLDEMEGEIESWELGNQPLAAEIESLEGDDHIDGELQALKDRMAAQQAPASQV